MIVFSKSKVTKITNQVDQVYKTHFQSHLPNLIMLGNSPLLPVGIPSPGTVNEKLLEFEINYHYKRRNLMETYIVKLWRKENQVRPHKSQHNFKMDKRWKKDKSTSPDPLMLLHVVLIICSDQELKSRKHVQRKAWEILVPVNTFMSRCRTNLN